jgi:hypothetical protein
MSDALVSHFQMLDSRRDRAELDKGGAGQNKVFWEDIVLGLNDYSEEKKSFGVLVLTSACDKKLFSEKNMTPLSKQN